MLLNTFYLSLDKIFHFQYGKILLALTSLSEVEAMMAKDWPYFTSFSGDIDQCLSGVTCSLLQSLGIDF